MNLQKTTVDWLEFRSQASVADSLCALRALFSATGLEPSVGKRGQLHLGQMIIGRVRRGDAVQGNWWRWSLTGRGCDQVADWASLDASPSCRMPKFDAST